MVGCGLNDYYWETIYNTNITNIYWFFKFLNISSAKARVANKSITNVESNSNAGVYHMGEEKSVVKFSLVDFHLFTAKQDLN